MTQKEWKKIIGGVQLSNRVVPNHSRFSALFLVDGGDKDYLWLYYAKRYPAFIVFSRLPGKDTTVVFGESQNAVNLVNELLAPYVL